MDDQPVAARRQRHRRQRRRHRALAGSVAVAAAIGTAVIPASSASADNLSPVAFWINSPTGLCMDLAGDPVPYGMVRTWNCNYTVAQQWQYDFTDGTVRYGPNHDYCLDVYHSGTEPETPIDIYLCNGTGAQRWNILSGFFINPESGLCLNVRGQDPNPGPQLWLWNCRPNPPQNWSAYPISNLARYVP